MKTEEPYTDETGREIHEFDLIKVFHFIGARRKKHYMYKWIRLIEWNDEKWWVAMHLMGDKPESYYHLRTVANTERRIMGTVIIQSAHD